MNRLTHFVAAGTLLVFGAAAQGPEGVSRDLAKTKAEAEESMIRMKTVGAVRGMTVKNAPYSGEEVSETNQVLADGTRIHRENHTTVYRDSEGRTRRETPDNITITDPVANVTYLLDPKSMTGQKLAMAMGTFAFMRTNGPNVAMTNEGTSSFAIHSSGDGPATITINGQALDEKQVAEAMAKAKASGSPQTFTYERHEIITTGSPESGSTSSSSSASSTGGNVGYAVSGGGTGGRAGTFTAAIPANRMMLRKGSGESLGKQMVEGVNAEGMRETATIPAGAIGNDRPLQVTSESWYSEELQMTIMSKHSDPRTGDESFRLTNIRRGEPGAYLFQAPSGYQISEPKGEPFMRR